MVILTFKRCANSFASVNVNMDPKEPHQAYLDPNRGSLQKL